MSYRKSLLFCVPDWTMRITHRCLLPQRDKMPFTYMEDISKRRRILKKRLSCTPFKLLSSSFVSECLFFQFTGDTFPFIFSLHVWLSACISVSFFLSIFLASLHPLACIFLIFSQVLKVKNKIYNLLLFCNDQHKSCQNITSSSYKLIIFKWTFLGIASTFHLGRRAVTKKEEVVGTVGGTGSGRNERGRIFVGHHV